MDNEEAFLDEEIQEYEEMVEEQQLADDDNVENDPEEQEEYMPSSDEFFFHIHELIGQQSTYVFILDFLFLNC